MALCSLAIAASIADNILKTVPNSCIPHFFFLFMYLLSLFVIHSFEFCLDLIV